MREMHIRIICDLCQNEVSEEAASEIELKIGRLSYTLDACGSCASTLTSAARRVPTAKAAAKKAQASIQPPAQAQVLADGDRWPCPEKGCAFTSHSQAGLKLHRTRKHAAQ